MTDRHHRRDEANASANRLSSGEILHSGRLPLITQSTTLSFPSARGPQESWRAARDPAGLTTSLPTDCAPSRRQRRRPCLPSGLAGGLCASIAAQARRRAGSLTHSCRCPARPPARGSRLAPRTVLASPSPPGQDQSPQARLRQPRRCPRPPRPVQPARCRQPRGRRQSHRIRPSPVACPPPSGQPRLRVCQLPRCCQPPQSRRPPRIRQPPPVRQQTSRQLPLRVRQSPRCLTGSPGRPGPPGLTQRPRSGLRPPSRERTAARPPYPPPPLPRSQARHPPDSPRRSNPPEPGRPSRLLPPPLLLPPRP